MRFDIFIAVLFIMLGLICLATSGIFIAGFHAGIFFKTLLQVLMWMGLPLLITAVAYYYYWNRKE